MEIRDYIKFLAKNYSLVIIITVAFAGVAYYLSATQPSTYESSASIEVTRFDAQNQKETPYFQYDNYYSTQAASAASDNMIGWIGSASTAAEVYTRAGYDIPNVSLKDLAKTFTAYKTVGTSAVISISYSSQDKEKSKTMILTATEVLKEKIEAYDNVSNQSVFSVQSNNPVTVITPKMEGLNTAIATFVGLLLAIGVASIREAVRNPE